MARALLKGNSLPDAATAPVLVRQNTFTKDDSAAETEAVVTRVSSGFKMQRARMVGGNIVKPTMSDYNYEWSAEDDEVAAYSLSDLRADVKRPQDNLKMEGAFQNRYADSSN